MSNNLSPTQVASVVPNIWFDIFGRIVPGGYLILGTIGLTWKSTATGTLLQYLERNPVAGLPIIFLLSLGASYMIGWLLGIASFWVVQDGLKDFWTRMSDKTPTFVPQDVEKIIASKCGQDWCKDISGDFKILKARDLCTYLIWHTDPALAVIFGRWDAEALGARSTCLVSMALIGVAVIECRPYLLLAIIVILLLIVIGLSLAAFGYHYKRALSARFDMVLVLLGSQIAPTTPFATPPSSAQSTQN